MPLADRDRPTYSLAAIQELVRAKQYTVMGRAEADARKLGLLAAMPDCICALTDIPARAGGHFHKSSVARNPPPDAVGRWHDIYWIVYEDVALYIKLQLASNGKAVVISFHENTAKW